MEQAQTDIDGNQQFETIETPYVKMISELMDKIDALGISSIQESTIVQYISLLPENTEEGQVAKTIDEVLVKIKNFLASEKLEDSSNKIPLNTNYNGLEFLPY